MRGKSTTARISLDVSVEFHKKLKAIAAVRGQSMRQIILTHLESLEPYNQCPYDHTPNEITIKAIKEAKNKKKLIAASDIEDLFKKLGID